MKNRNIQSFDDGFGDNKGDNGQKLIRIPTAYADWRPKPNNNFGNETSIETEDEHYDSNYKYISYRSGSDKYIVGESALRQSTNINWFGGENKHNDIGFPIMLKTGLGLMAKAESSVLDLLVMGLPCNSDTPERRRQLEQMILNHHHKMELELYDGTLLDRDVHVRNLIIKKQPFGSFCDVLLDSNGDIDNMELANSFTVVVDIGSRTLNIYTLNRMDEVPDLIDTTNNGMYTSYMRIGKFIQQETNFKVPTGKLPLIVKEKQFNNFDLSEVVDKSHRKLAYEIKNIIDTMLIDSYGYVSQIIFTGGGSEILREHLCEIFQHQDIITLDRYATARGLRKYGLFKSDEVIKDVNDIDVRIG